MSKPLELPVINCPPDCGHCCTVASCHGGRGTVMCGEWRGNFAAFRDWAIANGYRDDLSIDRIDPNGNYDPGNCRWATPKQQSANTRKPRRKTSSVFKGVSLSQRKRRWRAQLGSTHIGIFFTELEAALAYDDAAFEAYGKYAYLNFPERKHADTALSEGDVGILVKLIREASDG